MEYRSWKSTLSNALDRLNKYSPYKKGLLTPLPEIGLDEILDDSTISEDLEAAQRILDNDVAIRSITAQENREHATISAMEPWLDMDQDLGQTHTETCEIAYGTIPTHESLDDARTALKEYDADLSLVSEGKQFYFICLVYYKGLGEDVVNALKPLSFVPIVMTGLTGTPKEVTAKAQQALEQLAEDKKKRTDAIIAESDNRKKLQRGLDTLQTIIDREEAGQKTLTTKSTFAIEGWLTAPDEEKLSETLNKYKVTFVDDDGTVLKKAVKYDYGTPAADIKKPADPTKPDTAEYIYVFNGWSPKIAKVTGDATYTATYKEKKKPGPEPVVTGWKKESGSWY